MPSITMTHKGTFTNTQSKLNRMSKGMIQEVLGKYGALGVHVLSQATPIDSGESRNSWTSKVEKKGKGWRLSWHNQNRTVNGQPVVILIQFGHGTGTGGYVAGQDFINPAIKPVFDLIIAEVRRKVAS
ncbi:hypothetical protein HWC49_gp31 [Gordonia phage Kenosha]|uniref:Uncharacterized protein n=4 Tax=Kenoshavirus TaxID=2842796 RepID=A0A649V9R7_9CAUD|nr:hypothetical protein HWC49_gp31 [Gordonia phage Kenosha]YP_009852133.1 hypothetical protein HWC66_gp31 [Gordonia phage Chikenjars]YP_009853690.1 hypothetical protein HWC79_gp31 [Gordonia phage Untouchable]YP_009853894.1 hypothetical protein HWC81_gp31 [Gordonia phage Crocheter]QXO14055.1 hypothetical protein SEA_ALAINAMARIE_31 [Gordonia phage AlainaMarie]QXO14636.1 hypothetical protein SEA_RUNHAAR_31 [Gordonia phage Runhaar]QYC53956.1 hypothetical protein SEA_NITHYA_31 [Gordonia phage Nith